MATVAICRTLADENARDLPWDLRRPKYAIPIPRSLWGLTPKAAGEALRSGGSSFRASPQTPKLVRSNRPTKKVPEWIVSLIFDFRPIDSCAAIPGAATTTSRLRLEQREAPLAVDKLPNKAR